MSTPNTQIAPITYRNDASPAVALPPNSVGSRLYEGFVPAFPALDPTFSNVTGVSIANAYVQLTQVRYEAARLVHTYGTIRFTCNTSATVFGWTWRLNAGTTVAGTNGVVDPAFIDWRAIPNPNGTSISSFSARRTATLGYGLFADIYGEAVNATDIEFTGRASQTSTLCEFYAIIVDMWVPIP